MTTPLPLPLLQRGSSGGIRLQNSEEKALKKKGKEEQSQEEEKVQEEEAKPSKESKSFIRKKKLKVKGV